MTLNVAEMISKKISRQQSYSTSSTVSTGVGDRFPAGILFRYVTGQLGQLSLASLRGR